MFHPDVRNITVNVTDASLHWGSAWSCRTAPSRSPPHSPLSSCRRGEPSRAGTGASAWAWTEPGPWPWRDLSCAPSTHWRSPASAGGPGLTDCPKFGRNRHLWSGLKTHHTCKKKCFYRSFPPKPLTSYPVMAMRCIESLTAFRIPRMEERASCRSSQPSQPLLYFNNSCKTHSRKEVKDTAEINIIPREVRQTWTQLTLRSSWYLVILWTGLRR